MVITSFTQEEQEELLANKYVLKIANDSQVIYSDEFKLHFVERYKAGERSSDIFAEAGFNIKLLGRKRIERACARWRQAYEEGTLDINEAKPVSTTTSFRTKPDEINDMKRIYSQELAALQKKLDETQKYVDFLHSKVLNLDNERLDNAQFKAQIHVKEDVDLSELTVSIGKTITELCRKYHINKVPLADSLGLSPLMLREIERGQRSLTVEQMLKLMIVFQCPLNTFIEDDLLELTIKR